MSPKVYQLARGGAAMLVLSLVLGACASPRGDGDAGRDHFSAPAAEEVFAAGYSNISDRYIEPISLRRVGIEGVRGLGAIDPELKVRPDGNDIVLAYGDHEIARRPLPISDDPRAWAALTVDLSLVGRQNSDDLRSADAEKLYEAVFDGVLSELDLYSRYAGASEARRHRAKREGFGGIGIRYRLVNGVATITQVTPKTPAAEANITPGDRITHIGKVAIGGLPSRRITDQIRGPLKTRVVLTIERDGRDTPFAVELERRHIVPETIRARIENGIIVARVLSFNQDTAASLGRKIKALRGKNADVAGLVLDMRSNPGGLLKQSVKVADLLLTQGTIVDTRGRHPDSLHSYEAGGDDLLAGLPVVVLIDGKSASAAEIVAAALQDRHRAVVVGTTSFGKGTVQTVVRLPNDGEMTLTWSRFVAPTGYMLQGLGVLPAVCTSGNKDDALALASALNDQAASSARMEDWRRPGLKGKDEAKALRAACPSQRRGDDVDLRVALRLLKAPALYARAMGVSASMASRP